MFDWMSTQSDARPIGQPVPAECVALEGQGVLAGTRVASSLGWRAVEALAAGDKLLTFDNGMQPIMDVRREATHIDTSLLPQDRWSMLVPAGALSNRTEMVVKWNQGILIESDVADEALGDPFALVPAFALEGVRGITRQRPPNVVQLTTIILERAEVIYAEGGTLLHCPAAGGDLLQAALLGDNYTWLNSELMALAVDEMRLDDALRLSQASYAA